MFGSVLFLGITDKLMSFDFYLYILVKVGVMFVTLIVFYYVCIGFLITF